MKQLSKTDYIILENGNPVRFNGSEDIVVYGSILDVYNDVYPGQVACPCIYAPVSIQTELLIQINRDYFTSLN